MNTIDGQLARRGVRQQSGRRALARANVLASLLLALAITGMVNYLGGRFYRRGDISGREDYRLSSKSLSVLAGLAGDLHVVVVFERSQLLYPEIRRLLREYEYQAARNPELRLRVEYVDPDRDIARSRELARDYDITEPNVVLFEASGRTRIVVSGDMERFEIRLSPDGAYRKRTGFLGEEVFSSAMNSVIRSERPTVYFLTGHGEHDIEDYSGQAGYAALVRAMRRDNMEVKPLLLAEYQGVPEDGSLLMIAGPNRKISRAELDLVAQYLNRNGRVCALVDPATDTGLESLLADWGVALSPDVVVGLNLTGLGRDLVVTRYGNHPITRALDGVAAMFYMPRVVEPAPGAERGEEDEADRPRVSALAFNTADGWAEADPSQNPPRFDAGADRRGPVSIAVAVEKGPLKGVDVDIRPTRMVVIGDSYFVSNGALKRGMGGNLSFFLSAANWLVERESLLGVAPKAPSELRLDMSRRQVRTAAAVMVLALPGALSLLGWGVWMRRRH